MCRLRARSHDVPPPARAGQPCDEKPSGNERARGDNTSSAVASCLGNGLDWGATHVRGIGAESGEGLAHRGARVTGSDVRG